MILPNFNVFWAELDTDLPVVVVLKGSFNRFKCQMVYRGHDEIPRVEGETVLDNTILKNRVIFSDFLIPTGYYRNPFENIVLSQPNQTFLYENENPGDGYYYNIFQRIINQLGTSICH